MHLPAFCDTCGTVFRSGIVVNNAKNTTFVGNTSGPCPVCGGMGHIPDGVFNFVDNTIEILSAPDRTHEELSQLAKILKEAREKQQSPEEVSERIRNEVPEFSRLADFLPKNRAEFYAFLALIIAATSLYVQVGKGSDKTTNISVEQTINQTFVETEINVKQKDEKGDSEE